LPARPITLVCRWFPTPVRRDPIDRLVRLIRDLHNIHAAIVSLDVFSVLSARSREFIVKDPQIDCLLSQLPGIIAGVTIIGKAMEVVDPHS
jgi:hypothetical protein